MKNCIKRLNIFQESYDITAENINSILGNIKAKSASPVVYRITEGRIDLYKVEPNGDLVYTGKMVKGDREDDVTVSKATWKA